MRTKLPGFSGRKGEEGWWEKNQIGTNALPWQGPIEQIWGDKIKLSVKEGRERIIRKSADWVPSRMETRESYRKQGCTVGGSSADNGGRFLGDVEVRGKRGGGSGGTETGSRGFGNQHLSCR